MFHLFLGAALSGLWAFYIESPLNLDHLHWLWFFPIVGTLLAIGFRKNRTTRFLWGAFGLGLLLVGIAARPFTDVGREGFMAGNLSELRMKITEFQQKQGAFPTDLNLLGPIHDKLVLRLYPDHPKNAKVDIVHESTSSVHFPYDSGTWVYNPTTGQLIINCTHNRHHAGGIPWKDL